MLEFSGQLTTPDRFSYHTGLSCVAKVFQADCSKCLAWRPFKLSEEDDVDVGDKPSLFQAMSKVLERVRQLIRRARPLKKDIRDVLPVIFLSITKLIFMIVCNIVHRRMIFQK